MLDSVHLDQEIVWKIVRQIRKSFLSQKTDPKCQDLNTMLSDRYIKDNIDIVKENLKLKKEFSPNETVTDETLQTAAEIFTYLNYCPPKLLSFIKNLISTGTPKDIILGLTSAKMTLHNLKESPTKVLIKVMESLGLNHYQNIQMLTKGKCYNKNAIFGNCGKKINSTDRDILGIQ